jgi:ADP-heptose:LPS heptosyltransferase
VRKVILNTQLSLGDIVCFTATIRELHQQYPSRFMTDVRTPFLDVWAHNQHITSIADNDPESERIDCHYDRDAYVSVHRSNQHPVHLIEGYCQHLANRLGLESLRPKELKGHITLSRDEYNWMSMPHERFNVQRYWIIVCGGKTDATVKWWVPEHAQRVVDYFKGRIQFVQAGHLGDGHWHADLRGVIDLRGQTNVRELIRLVHSSAGVLCGITSFMHLAAAVPLPTWQKRPRPCVVVAGGREPRTWYSYPSHRILETVGSLPCCRDGGCWHARTVPLHGKDGDREKDPLDPANSRLCERVVSGHPKCMQMIRPESVILEIERILECQTVE